MISYKMINTALNLIKLYGNDKYDIMYYIHSILNSLKPTYGNDLRGLILELSRQALRVGGETFKVCRTNCATAKGWVCLMFECGVWWGPCR